jgi:hypothetical protein
VVDSLPLPPIYYSGGNKNYYRAEARGKWMPLNENSALKFIRSQGHNGAGGNGLSEEDNCLLRIQSEQSVDYVGPLAGYRAGPHEINGARILVTNSPQLIDCAFRRCRTPNPIPVGHAFRFLPDSSRSEATLGGKA